MYSVFDNADVVRRRNIRGLVIRHWRLTGHTRHRVFPVTGITSLTVMKANKQLSENLQAVLVDLIELHIQGKQAHWNVVGIKFRDTHFILDEIVDTAKVVSLITERLDAAAETCRRVHDEVDEADPTTADILHKLIETLEQCAWMVSAKSLKPRKRNATTGR